MNAVLSDDEHSYLQSPRVTDQVADLLDQTLVALQEADRFALYVSLSNLCALALQGEESVPWVPTDRAIRSEQDELLLQELIMLSALIVRPEAQGEFQKRLARWQQRGRWRQATSDLLLPFSYLARRMNHPRLVKPLAPADEVGALQRERYTVSALGWSVAQGLEHRDYPVVFDLLVEDLRRLSAI